MPLDPLPLPDAGADARTAPAMRAVPRAARPRRTARPGRRGPSTAWPGSAGRSTACRSRSSWPPPGPGPTASTRSPRRSAPTPARSAASAAAPAGHHSTVRVAVEQSYRTLSRGRGRAAPGARGGARPVHRRRRRRTRGAAGRRGRARCSPAWCTARCWCRSARRRRAGPSRFAQLAIVRGHAAHGGDRGATTAELVAARDAVGRASSGRRAAAARRRGRARLVRRTRRRPGGAARHAAPHASSTPRPRCGVQVASRLGLYWYYRGMMVEARQWQERAVRAGRRSASTGPWCGSCSAARWPWRTGATSARAAHRGRLGGRATARAAAPRRSAGHPRGRAASSAGDAGLGARNTELVRGGRRGDRRIPTVGLLARLARRARRRRRRPRRDGHRPRGRGVRRGRWRGQHLRRLDGLGRGRGRRAGSPRRREPACGGRTGWSPSTARCGCARARACSRSAPTCSRSPGEAPAAVRLYSAARAHNQRAGMRWPMRAGHHRAHREAAETRSTASRSKRRGRRARASRLDDLEPAPART